MRGHHHFKRFHRGAWLPALLALCASGTDAFASRHYLNLGLSWQQQDTVLRLQAYNVLGWDDQELNRRNTFSRAGQYRTEAAALALSWTQGF